MSTAPASLTKPGLVLLTAGTPNGYKVSIALEELRLAGALPKDGYAFENISFQKNEQKSDWFLEINPNGRIPALIDNREGKASINVWESASILRYLVETYDKDYVLHFKDADLETEMYNWIFYIHGGLGPMQGQANHFFRYAPEKIPYGIERYQTETRRIYSTYEAHFKKTGFKYLVGDKFSLADINTFPWVRSAFWAGVEIEDFPLLNEWCERIELRDGVKAGLKVPVQDSKTIHRLNPPTEEELERQAKQASAWVLKGVEADKKKHNKH